jgi:hypothetical protein
LSAESMIAEQGMGVGGVDATSDESQAAQDTTARTLATNAIIRTQAPIDLTHRGPTWQRRSWSQRRTPSDGPPLSRQACQHTASPPPPWQA